MQQTDSDLRITEIFYSLQGESRTVGLPTVFVRLTGCPLRCYYCDTEYAFTGGEIKTQQQVLDAVAAYQPRYITVTGGEPLAQKACIPLLEQLCNADYEVSLETSGAFSVAEVDERVVKVMDLKTPSSGEADKNHWDNIQWLSQKDQVKFVIGDQDDYEWAKSMIELHALEQRCDVLFSPIHGSLAPADLADWILQDRLSVRFQLQLHKYLWNDEPGR